VSNANMNRVSVNFFNSSPTPSLAKRRGENYPLSFEKRGEGVSFLYARKPYT
jgi:hypothetical protein